jgi:hypothetical protein
MPKLKPISPHAVPAAVEKAVRYRLLNEPGAAESICRDVLAIDPHHHDAKVTLLLALTDKFGRSDAACCAGEAQELAEAFEDPYERHYYLGIVHERNARAFLRSAKPGSAFIAHDLLQNAMHCFDAAEKVRRPGNDDSVLRWNSCVRLLAKHGCLQPAPAEERATISLE